MKRLPLFILFILTVCGVCAKGYTGQIVFVSNQVKEVNDSLHVSFKVNVREGAINDNNAISLTPQLLSDGYIVEFPCVLISGSKKHKLIKRWESLNKKKAAENVPYKSVIAKKDKDTLITYDFKVPYEKWMDESRFVVKQEISGCRNESRLFTFLLNNKVKLAPHIPYEPNTVVAYIEPKAEQKVRKVQGQAFLDFQIGQSKILPNYRNNAVELAKINDVITHVIDNPNATIKSLFIEGYASPDGSYEVNNRLSYARAVALKNYIRDRYRLPDTHFTVSNIAEDWDGLKELLREINMPYRDQAIEIIDNTDIFKGREAKLMNLAGGVPYKKMLRELFPKLRRVEYQINYGVKDFTIAEAKDLLSKRGVELSHQELFLLAFHYGEGSKEFRDILTEKTLHFFPNDETAYNNAAAAMIAMGELSMAKRLLAKAGTSPQSLNNLGVVVLHEGDLGTAEELFRRALDGGFEGARHNLDELIIKRDDNIKMERYQSNLMK